MRGSMTVFLALTLSLFLGVTGVLMDYARAQMLSYQAEAAAAAAAESVFAGYFAPLWGEYELFGRLVPEDSLEKLSEETCTYAKAWGGGSRGTFTAFSRLEASWDQVVFLTDENGAVFRELATRAIGSEAGEILLSEWKERLGLSRGDTAGKLTEGAARDEIRQDDVLPNYDEMKEALTEAEKEEEEARKAAEEARKKAEEAKKKAEEAGEEPAEETPAEESTEEMPSGTAAAAGETETPVPVVRDTRTPEEKAKARKYLQLIDTVRRLLGRGILRAVMPEGAVLSTAEISGGNLPSDLSGAEKDRSVRSGGGDGNGLLFREYLMRHMVCFTTDTDRSPHYELEYLITGKKDDEANLKSVVTKILWMRLGLNMMYLAKSPEKKAVTQEAAMLAVGWTGQPALIELTDQLLTAAWAAAESLMDVRELLGGGEVPLVKTDADWKLSLENAAEAWAEAGTGDAESGGTKSGSTGGTGKPEKGLSYADHLRICLYLKEEGTLSYRAMDVIQWNLRKLDQNFQMSACLEEGRLTLTAGGRLLLFPLYASLISGSGEMGTVVKQASFSYLEE